MIRQRPAVFLRLGFARFLVLALALCAGVASAQNWPDRPLKFIVAAPAGSSLDVLARTIADKLKDRLGQPVVVEDRPAAGGTAATDFVAKSAPDGYTMVISFNGPLAFGPHLYAKLPYDPFKDLAPVIITSSQPNVLAVNAALPVKSVNWSSMRRRIRASSTTPRSATAARRSSPWSSSRRRPASTSCTFHSTDRHRRSLQPSRAKRRCCSR
jgi:tripartite-type tricarboxylate transporter receptor subunit TctC